MKSDDIVREGGVELPVQYPVRDQGHREHGHSYSTEEGGIKERGGLPNQTRLAHGPEYSSVMINTTSMTDIVIPSIVGVE